MLLQKRAQLVTWRKQKEGEDTKEEHTNALEAAHVGVNHNNKGGQSSSLNLVLKETVTTISSTSNKGEESKTSSGGGGVARGSGRKWELELQNSTEMATESGASGEDRTTNRTEGGVAAELQNVTENATESGTSGEDRTTNRTGGGVASASAAPDSWSTEASAQKDVTSDPFLWSHGLLFEEIWLGDEVLLRSLAANKSLRLVNSGTGELRAAGMPGDLGDPQRFLVLPFEKELREQIWSDSFRRQLLQVGEKILLRSLENGRYLEVDPANPQEVRFGAADCRESAAFRLEKYNRELDTVEAFGSAVGRVLTGDVVFLRASHSQRFLDATPEGNVSAHWDLIVDQLCRAGHQNETGCDQGQADWQRFIFYSAV